eukprot:UN1851
MHAWPEIVLNAGNRGTARRQIEITGTRRRQCDPRWLVSHHFFKSLRKAGRKHAAKPSMEQVCTTEPLMSGFCSPSLMALWNFATTQSQAAHAAMPIAFFTLSAPALCAAQYPGAPISTYCPMAHPNHFVMTIEQSLLVEPFTKYLVCASSAWNIISNEYTALKNMPVPKI